MSIQIIGKIIKILILIGTISSFSHDVCVAADVLFVTHSKESSNMAQKMELVSQFYGVNLKRLSSETPRFNIDLKRALREAQLGAIVLEAGALRYIDSNEVLRSMKAPCLIVDVSPRIDARVLKLWSKGTVIGCTSVEGEFSKASYRVGDAKDITFELAGQTFPFSDTGNGKRYSLNVNKEKKHKILFEIGPNGMDNYRPIFIKVPLSGKEIFFHSGKEEESVNISSIEKDIDRFFEVAPLMAFIRYSLGKKCWLPAGYYANFTIDDPFLREPYGNLNYKILLSEMERTNFHTTIAFIPWNFDRSEKEVVTLFREHPERYSICIHGNNHDHKEFSLERPLAEQEGNIRQAIARMERFRTLTDVPYDRVMVFPHGIASLETLKMLKRYGYLSTVNQENIPLGVGREVGTAEALRFNSMSHGNFPSLKRYRVSDSMLSIPITLFLNGSILIYGHQDLFQKDLLRLQETVSAINRIRPDIEWRSLGYISERLYLQRFDNDGECHIKAMSSNFVLENKSKQEVKYHVTKEENCIPGIRNVRLDGKTWGYEIRGRYIFFVVTIPPEQSRHILIENKNDTALQLVDTSKEGIYIRLLRNISDFRDLVIARTWIGTEIIGIYYGSTTYGLRVVASGMLLFSIVGVLMIAYRRRLARGGRKGGRR